MRIKHFSKFKSTRLLLFFCFLSFLVPLTIFAQSNALSLVDIFTALRSKKATLEQKNQLLSEGINQRGITFTLSKSLEEELQNAGANETLIDVIRQKSIPVVSITNAKVEVTPKPADPPPARDYAYYQNKGNSSYVIGEYAAAIKHYSDAIKLNEKESSLYLSRGIARIKEKKYIPAIEDFDKVIELDPNESVAYFNRGNALKEIGRFEAALVDYKKTTELDNENESAKIAFEKLQLDLKPKSDISDKPPSNDTPNSVAIVTDGEQIESAVPLNIGSLQSLIVKLASPSYPAVQRSIGVEGIVIVRVILDEKGKVISAEAIDGPQALYSYCEIAAKRSKFKPHKVDDLAVRVTGIINYSFKKR